MSQPEDESFAEAVAELRDRRRERALELRGEGVSAREIARRLGVSHPTILADLSGEEPEQTPDEWIRQRAGRGAQNDGQPFDGNAYIRERAGRHPRAQRMVDRLMSEFDTEEGEPQ